MTHHFVLRLLGSCALIGALHAAAVSSADGLVADVAAPPLKDTARIAGIFVKDSSSDNGQLRFLASGLTSGSNSGSNSLNAALNQYINQKQDMLEQLRPASTTGSGSTGTGTYTSGTGTGTGTATVTGTGTGSGSTTGSLGVQPIIVNLGNGGGSSSSSSAASNSALNSAIYGSSPIAGLLPQIVAQSVTRRGVANNNNNRRRVQNRRRVVNANRRRRKGNGNGNVNKRRRGGNRKNSQVYVIRPKH